MKARAAVFDDGEASVALIGLDVLVVGAETVRRIREAAERKTAGRVKAGDILIAASHTHSSGPLCGYRPAELAEAPPLIRKLALECSINIEPDYEQLVVERASDAVYLAGQRMEAVSFCAGSGSDGSAVFNRRIRMKDGRALTHPGKGNPEIVGPAGPIDSEVGVIGGWREDGTLAGCVVNYACHGTTWGGTVSADWIGALDKTIRAVYGADAVVVFLNGAAGDITQVDNIGLRQARPNKDNLEIIGTRVGAEAVKVLVSAERGALAPVRSISQTLTLPRRLPSPEKRGRAVKTVERLLGDPGASRTPEFIWAKERVLLDYSLQFERAKAVELQAIQLGPAVFLSNPAEYFCSLGLSIKAAVRKRFPLVYVVELANGSIGYVPDEEAFGAAGGGYETRLTAYSNLEPDAGRRIAEACIALAGMLQPGRLPEGPRVEAPAPLWAYGNTPPELD